MPLYEFPKTITIDGDKELTVRPLRKEDERQLHHFFMGLPAEEVARFEEDVTNPEVVERWIYDLDYDDILPLVAMDDGRVVANAALQLNEMGWTRHKGQIRATVAPAYREKGLSMVLIQEMISIGIKLGLEQITAELSPQLDEAYFMCEKMGFKEAAVLKDFIKDKEGNYEDLVIMIKDLLN
jgi:L-amino acid N-acyltransferase YncA